MGEEETKTREGEWSGSVFRNNSHSLMQLHSHDMHVHGDTHVCMVACMRACVRTLEGVDVGVEEGLDGAREVPEEVERGAAKPRHLVEQFPRTARVHMHMRVHMREHMQSCEGSRTEMGACSESGEQEAGKQQPADSVRANAHAYACMRMGAYRLCCAEALRCMRSTMCATCAPTVIPLATRLVYSSIDSCVPCECMFICMCM
jgi:hypothetical protein